MPNPTIPKLIHIRRTKKFGIFILEMFFLRFFIVLTKKIHSCLKIVQFLKCPCEKESLEPKKGHASGEDSALAAIFKVIGAAHFECLFLLAAHIKKGHASGKDRMAQKPSQKTIEISPKNTKTCPKKIMHLLQSSK